MFKNLVALIAFVGAASASVLPRQTQSGSGEFYL